MINVYNDTPVKSPDYQNTVLTLRLTEPEAVRFWVVMDEAKKRNAYVGKSDIYRELLGLSPLNVLTEDDVEYFRTGAKIGRVNQNEKPLLKLG